MARRFRSLRRRGPLALIGVSSAVPTAAVDGDGPARRAHSSMRSIAILAQLSAEEAFPRAAGSSSPALDCADEAADGSRRRCALC